MISAVLLLLAQSDVADISSQDLRAGKDADKRYFLIGPRKDIKAPEDGFGLILVLPGGSGSADFHAFVKRIYKHAAGDGVLMAQMVSKEWRPGQFTRVVWPTDAGRVPGMKFTTEQFAAAVIADVGKRHKIDGKRVFTLSWSSGGPAAYAISMTPESAVRGSLVAMSVFKPQQLKLAQSKGRAYYLYHSPDDRVCPIRLARKAVTDLTRNGAKVELAEYSGGHGWRGPIYPNLRKGFRWLEENASGP